ncbi:hypothetical protein ACEWY4_017489 [Coilia grayii]|uniref:Uncharacterized protein n=1 Tax=Coilia grayii TaxID=363190 RepID=A0ABD1JJ72_9TELE
MGDLVLWDGPLGKTIGGTHPDLFEKVDLAVYRSETHIARSMRAASSVYKEAIVSQEHTITWSAATTKEILEWFRWDSIGAACSPQCSGYEEVHLHRFLWRDNPEDVIEEFAVVRVNIADKPAGCIAQVAMKETANLPQFAHIVEERRALTEDSYVDDILTSHNNLRTLERITKGVEEILKAGGFFLKPWVLSCQSGRSEATEVPSEDTATAQPTMLVLPNQMHDGENKVLGVSYEPETDQLRLLTSINFSKKRGKMRTGLNLRMEDVRGETPNPLTRHILLSQIASLYDPIGLASLYDPIGLASLYDPIGLASLYDPIGLASLYDPIGLASLYDPIGLVSPDKQKGVMLVREAFQESGRDSKSQDTWDAPLSPRLREAATTLFEEYVRLGQVRFERSLTPTGATGPPIGVTFSDGSESSYGAVLYLRWETQGGVRVKLVESKAKLTPLDQKGDVIKAELCGAVFATRLKRYFEKHCHTKRSHTGFTLWTAKQSLQPSKRTAMDIRSFSGLVGL